MKLYWKELLLAGTVLTSTQAKAETPIKIEIGKTYDGYSNEDLKRRVWQLERAVTQLQEQVFKLAMRGDGRIPTWTCYVQSFSKTFTASSATKAESLAQVLKQCGDASNAIHCRESEVKCDKE